MARLLQQHWAGLLGLLLISVLAWNMAGWTWHFAGPRAPGLLSDTVRGDTGASVDAILARHLFGQAGSVAAQPAAQTQTTLSLRLRGVFAGLGVAIINADGKTDQAFRAGDELMPGVTLQGVYPEHVELLHGGVPERLDLYQDTAAAALVSSALTVRTMGAGHYAVARNELVRAIQDPKLLANSGQVANEPGGGVMLRQVVPGGLLAQLGFMQGDVITRLNSKQLGNAGDLAGVAELLAQPGTIEVEGRRGGQPLRMSYTVQQ